MLPEVLVLQVLKLWVFLWITGRYLAAAPGQAFALKMPPGRLWTADWRPVENAFFHRKLSMKLLRRVLNCGSALRSASTFRIEWMTVE